MSDFDEAIVTYDSPLLKLPKDVLDEFRQSIVVRPNIGIVSFKYSHIKELLSYDDFAVVISMFGLDAKQGFWGFSNDKDIIEKLQFTKPALKTNGADDGDGGDNLTDHKDYACSVVDNHTCIAWKDYICLTGC